MKFTKPLTCISHDLLRYVRDQRPTIAEMLEWLGPLEQGRYYVLLKAGLLEVQDGRVVLSPQHCSPEGKRFYYNNYGFLIDEDLVQCYVLRLSRDHGDQTVEVVLPEVQRPHP